MFHHRISLLTSAISILALSHIKNRETLNEISYHHRSQHFNLSHQCKILIMNRSYLRNQLKRCQIWRLRKL
jgi:hypothetical protein